MIAWFRIESVRLWPIGAHTPAANLSGDLEFEQISLRVGGLRSVWPHQGYLLCILFDDAVSRKDDQIWYQSVLALEHLLDPRTPLTLR